MIPKIIHYCWFGNNELDHLSKRCIETWKEILPEYEFQLWNESNSDLDDPIVKHAIKCKKWAFVSDYVRLCVLKQYGGIYLDTDVEVIKSFDTLLDNDFFVGEESKKWINGAVIGSKKNSKEIIKILESRMKMSKETNDFIEIPKIITNALAELGYLDGKKIDGVEIFSPEVFYPFNPYDSENYKSQLLYKDIKNNTLAIHHWSKSWKASLVERILKKIRQAFGLK